jgi:LPS sulfotransferase NodH
MMMPRLRQRWQPKRQPPVRFILLCHPRCGSNLLTWALHDHDAVQMFGELFHEDEDAAGAVLTDHILAYHPNRNAAKFLAQDVFPPYSKAHVRARGFKLFYDHARSNDAQKSAWDYLIDAADIRVIHLIRRNLLDCLVSLEIALRTGTWFLPLGTAAPPPVAPFSLDPWVAQEYFSRFTAWRLWAAQAFAHHPMLTLDYETDICGNFAGTMAQVCDFLDVPRVAGATTLLRQQARPPAEQLLNHDELRDWFRHSLFEGFFAPPGAA